MANNNPYQKFIDNGYFELVETTKTTSYGDKLFTKTMVKGKGQIKIVELLKEFFQNFLDNKFLSCLFFDL